MDSTPDAKPNSDDAVRHSGTDRGRRVAFSLVGNVGFKGLSTLLNFATVPIAVHCLASERYAMWILITSFAAVLGFADLGMGNGVLNAISEAEAKQDRPRAQASIASAFYLLLWIAIAIIGVTVVTLPFVPWARIFNVQSPLAVAEAGPAMAIFVACTALQMPLGVVQRVLCGLQEVFRATVWQVVGLVASFVAMLVAVAFHAGLPALLLAYVGASVVVAAVNFWVEMHQRRPWLWPQWQLRSRKVARGLFNVGVAFVALQLANWLALWSDNLVVAEVFGAKALTSYGIAFKLFSAAMIFQYIGPGLWPAYTDAIARGDYGWAKRTFYRGFWMNSLLSALAAVILYFTSPWILRHWAGPAGVLTPDVNLAFCIWLFLYSFIGVFAAFCNGGRNLGVHTFLFCLASVLSVPLRIALAHSMGSAAGVLYASTITFGFLYVLPMTIVVYRYFARNQPTETSPTVAAEPANS